MVATRSGILGWKESRHHDLSTVERFVLFAGWPRSAHTLVGSLLTAHPDAAVSHELNVLKYIDRGVERDALFGLLLRRDRRFAAAGSKYTGYSYAVPGQWQGRYRDLRVIGDKKGGLTSLLLHDRPQLFDALRRTVRVPIQVVVVTRHPLDNIARMASRATWLRRFRSFEAVLDHEVDTFFAMADAVEWLRGEADIFWMGHEDFVARPAGGLSGLLDHLHLEHDETYLDAASSIVFESPRRARDAIDWPPGRIDAVMERSQGYRFLAAYT